MKTHTLLQALLLLALSACSPPEGTEPANVILICLDTVRADHVGCYGYARDTTPTLDSLAADGLVFHDTTAASGWTKPSVPSYMTGTYPMQHGVYEGSASGAHGKRSDVLPMNSVTLAEVYRDHGYRTGAYIRNAQLRPGQGIDQGFDSYVDEAGDARSICEQGKDWIEAGSEEAKPFFLYLHFLDAHWPYPIPEEAAHRFAEGRDVEQFRGSDSSAQRKAINSGELRLSEDDRQALIDLYDGAIRYIDDELGQLLEFLEDQGLADNTIICIVSDHGEEFLEHGRIGHGHGLWQNLVGVPWILAVPGRAPEEISTPVSLIDLFPTLLTASGIKAPTTHVGTDRMHNPAYVAPILSEHKGNKEYLQAVRIGDRKWLRKLRPRMTLQPDWHPSSAIVRGSRWEVEVANGGEDQWTAFKIQPRSEPSAAPLEFKGPVSRSADGSLMLARSPLDLSPTVTFYGDLRADPGKPGMLADGTWIKAKGEFRGDVFHSSRIKVYADPGTNPRIELRGRVQDLKMDSSVQGRIQIGGQWIRYDPDTEWKVDQEDFTQSPMDREVLLSRLNQLAKGESPEGCIVTTLSFSLTDDREEARGKLATDDTPEDWPDFLGYLLKKRNFTATDQRDVGEEDLNRLRAIGYAE